MFCAEAGSPEGNNRPSVAVGETIGEFCCEQDVIYFWMWAVKACYEPREGSRDQKH